MSYEVVDSKRPSPIEQKAATPLFKLQEASHTLEDDILVSDSQINNLLIEEGMSQSSVEQAPSPKKPLVHHKRKVSSIASQNNRKSETFWSSSNAQLWESLNLKSQSQNIVLKSHEKRLSNFTHEKTALFNALKNKNASNEKGWIPTHDHVNLTQIKQTANLYNKKFINRKKENVKDDRYTSEDAKLGPLQKSDGFTTYLKPSLDMSKLRSFNHKELRKPLGLKRDDSRNSSVKAKNEAAQQVKSMTSSLVKQKHYMSEKHQEYMLQIGPNMSRSTEKDAILRQRQKLT